MKNYVQEGKTLTLVAPYAVPSGGGLLVGNIFGFANHAAANGAAVETSTEGVFTHAKTAAQAITQGGFVYWDNANKLLTSTSAGNKLVGVAVAAAAGSDANVAVKLLPIVA